MNHDTYRISTILTAYIYAHKSYTLCPSCLLHMDTLLVVLLEYYVYNLYYK